MVAVRCPENSGERDARRSRRGLLRLVVPDFPTPFLDKRTGPLRYFPPAEWERLVKANPGIAEHHAKSGFVVEPVVDVGEVLRELDRLDAAAPLAKARGAGGGR